MVHKKYIFLFFLFASVFVDYCPAQNEVSSEPNLLAEAKMLVEYFEQMSIPKPLVIRQGQQFQEHQRQLRQKLLEMCRLISAARTYPARYSQN